MYELWKLPSHPSYFCSSGMAGKECGQSILTILGSGTLPSKDRKSNSCFMEESKTDWECWGEWPGRVFALSICTWTCLPLLRGAPCMNTQGRATGRKRNGCFILATQGIIHSVYSFGGASLICSGHHEYVSLVLALIYVV